MPQVKVNGVLLTDAKIRFETGEGEDIGWTLAGTETAPIPFMKDLSGNYSCFVEVEGRSASVDLVGTQIESGGLPRHEFRGVVPFPFSLIEWKQILATDGKQPSEP